MWSLPEITNNVFDFLNVSAEISEHSLHYILEKIETTNKLFCPHRGILGRRATDSARKKPLGDIKGHDYVKATQIYFHQWSHFSARIVSKASQDRTTTSRCRKKLRAQKSRDTCEQRKRWHLPEG